MECLRVVNIVILVAVLLSAGCVVYPEKAVERDGYTGRLFNSETKQPLAGSKVTLDLGREKAVRKTDNDGYFCIPRKYHWYISWVLCGPVLVFQRPDGVTFSVNGYHEKKYCFESAADRCGLESSMIERRYAVDGNLSLGDIYLKPKKGEDL